MGGVRFTVNVDSKRAEFRTTRKQMNVSTVN